MSKTGICCERCFRKICSHSIPAAKLWLNMCEQKLTYNDCYGLVTEEQEGLRELEILQFIITTDIKQSIKVKLNGEKYDSKGPYFCCENCNE